MPNIEIEGHSFYYTERDGNKPSIIILCSTGLDSRQWKDVFELLSDRRLIILHYLGYHPSEKWNNENPPDINIDYLAAELLLTNESGSVDLLGHSYGGFIALKLAVKYPKKIRKIALHEPIAWGCLDYTEKDDLKDDFGNVVETFFTEGLSIEDFLEDFVDYWNEPGTWENMSESRKDNWRVLQPKILAEVRLLCYDKTPPEYWKKVNSPVFITVSRETPPHQFEVCQILCSLIPNVSLKYVPGGHMGILTRSKIVLPLLTKWLE